MMCGSDPSGYSELSSVVRRSLLGGCGRCDADSLRPCVDFFLAGVTSSTSFAPLQQASISSLLGAAGSRQVGATCFLLQQSVWVHKNENKMVVVVDVVTSDGENDPNESYVARNEARTQLNMVIQTMQKLTIPLLGCLGI